MLFYKKSHTEFYDFLLDIKKNDRKIYNKAKRYYLFKVKPYHNIKTLAKKIIKKDSWLYKKLKK
jgi:hypothetical protein